MSSREVGYAGSGRALWGGLALVALALIGATFLLADRAEEQAGMDARERAVALTSNVLVEAVPPEVVEEGIVGDDRRDLTETIRTKILDDARVARVLIWTPEGDLLFSTLGPDDTNADDLPFSQAAGGATASAVVQSGRITGPLHRTLIPLRPIGESETYAVVQIDQRLDAIAAEATEPWRIARIALFVLLGVAVLALVSTFRRRQVPVDDASERDAERMLEVQERTLAAERAEREAKEELSLVRRQMEEASLLELPPRVVAQIEQLESDLERATAEQQRAADEADRLRETLDANEDRFARSETLLADAERRAEELEARAQEAEARVAGAEARATEAEARAAQAELRVAEADERAARSEARVAEVQAELQLLAARGSDEGEAVSAPVVGATPAPEPTPVPEPAVPDVPASVLELTLIRDERDVARADLARAERELEQARVELEAMRERGSSLKDNATP